MENKKITFMDLSMPLKILAVGCWAMLTLWVYGMLSIFFWGIV